MRLPLLLCVTTLAASAVFAEDANSPSKSTQSTQSDQSSQPGISSQSSPSSSSILSATGRGSGHAGSQHHFRGSKIMGSQVKTSTGEDVGRIEDVVLNPTSGRIDFAVITSEGKLLPVPWQLLSVGHGASAQGSTSSSSSTTSGTSTSTDPSSTSPSSTASTATPGSSGIYASASASGQQPSFTLNVDKSKLQAAPSFDRSRWPEMSASWSQRVYSHFGVSATGVGGTGAGSYRGGSSSQGSSTIDQGSTGSSTDSSSGKASSDSDKSSSDPSKSSDSKK